jgi:hypothetical protein
MNPLLFSDWSRLNRWFRNLMWVIVVIFLLAILILGANNQPQSVSKQTAPRVVVGR